MHGGFSRLPWGAPSRPAPPRCRSLCCRLMASAHFGMRAAPSRRNGGPRPSSALPLFRCRRPRLRSWRRQRGAKACAPAAGFRCAPLCPCCAVSRGSGGGRPLRQAPAIPFFLEWWRLAPPGPLRRRRPVRRSCCGQPRWGGLLQRPLAAAPLRRRAPPLRPRPPVLAPGRGYFVFAAAGLGIAPPAGGAKGLPNCTRCAM